ASGPGLERRRGHPEFGLSRGGGAATGPWRRHEGPDLHRQYFAARLPPRGGRRPVGRFAPADLESSPIPVAPPPATISRVHWPRVRRLGLVLLTALAVALACAY